MTEEKFRERWLFVWRMVSVAAPFIPGQLDDRIAAACQQEDVLADVVDVMKRIGLVKADPVATPLPNIDLPGDQTNPTWQNPR